MPGGRIVADAVNHALETAHPDPGPAAHQRRFEALYREHFTFVWSVARHLGVPPMAIEDLVQDVFLTAYRRLDHLRYEVSPRAWLFGVTRRIAYRYRRGAARRMRQTTAFAEVVRPPGAAPQQRYDDAQQLTRLLAPLSDISRTVWEMTELLGMSAPEIASELGVPLNTVYSRLRLARGQLQALADTHALAALRDDVRRAREPSGAVQQRTWALMLPVLGNQGLGAGVIAWIKTQSVMATTLLATGIVAVGLVVRPGPSLSPRSPANVATQAQTTRPVTDSAPPTLQVAQDAAPGQPLAAVAVPSAERRSAARPATSSGDPADLREEIALIDRAQLQLAEDDISAAMATLDTHARRFPAGFFADIREAAFINVLCRRGDAAGAEASARRLRVDHPESAVAQRFANYRCPG